MDPIYLYYSWVKKVGSYNDKYQLTSVSAVEFFLGVSLILSYFRLWLIYWESY